jgi:hypothetical protein
VHPCALYGPRGTGEVIGRVILIARSGATVARRVVRDEKVVLLGQSDQAVVGECRVLKVERGLERRAGVQPVERGVVLRLEVYGGDQRMLSRRRR